MPTKTTIKRSNCNTDIDVNGILYHRLENELKQKELKNARCKKSLQVQRECK